MHFLYFFSLFFVYPLHKIDFMLHNYIRNGASLTGPTGAVWELRGAVRATNQERNKMSKEKGKVKWFNNAKGFGFIEREQGGDIFVHYSSIKVDGYRTLKEGQSVEFVVSQGEKGLQADDVVALSE